jgi:hypothetical protein
MFRIEVLARLARMAIPAYALFNLVGTTMQDLVKEIYSPVNSPADISSH